MSTVSELDLGVNIMWKDLADPSNPKTKVAIVFLIDDNQVTAAPVESATASTRGHDKGGANEQCDEHNVSLKGYESIYENILNQTGYGYYATADPHKLVYIDNNFLAEHHVGLIPDTEPMPYEIVIELQNHIWRDELEEQIPLTFNQFNNCWNQTQPSNPASRPVPPIPSPKDSPAEGEPEVR